MQTSMMNTVFCPSLPSTLAASHHTSADWVTYFRFNREHRMSLPWGSDIPLTDTEKATIAHSISCFQLGESSEGIHLMRLARQHAEHVGDHHWVDAVKLFIGEEQRHARELGRFMQQHHLPLAQKHWSDTWFRQLRRLANLEMVLMILLTAELVATIYYPALGAATGSPLLRDLCQQIHHDEMRHIQFQTETLRKIWRSHPGWRRQATHLLYGWFFRATLLAVWVSHAPVLRAAGYSWRQFYREACVAFHKTKLQEG